MKKLQKYHQKRNFDKTDEPVGQKRTRKSGTPIFVVQHHIARKDHFDFRLEWKGALLSFAVPKGPSYNSKDKRLAVQVEDHPIDYADFEGTIPKGEYGGGTVMLWDEGNFSALNNFSKGLKKGVLKFELFGKRLRGKWTLVKMDDEHKNWLLIKEVDEFAKDSPSIEQFVTSVKTGRTMEEISKDEKVEDGKKIEKTQKKEAKTSKKTEKKNKIQKNPFEKFDFQLCTLVKNVPEDDKFVYEVKYDGFRIGCFAQNGDVKLLTRNKVDYTSKLQSLAKSLCRLSQGRSFVVDGEVIVPDGVGRPDFQALQNALKRGEEEKIVYMIFDILALDGVDLRKKSFSERKEILKTLLQGSNANLCYVEHFEGSGKNFFKAVLKLGLEGVVAKRKKSQYVGGRNDDWQKIKCRPSQEFVVCGFLSSDKKELSALVLGCYLNDRLIFVGKCGTGFDERESKELLQKFHKLKSEKCPFESAGNDAFEKSCKGEKICWLKPKFVVQIEYAQMSRDGILRQASFKGLRDDKSAKEVVFENPKNDAKNEKTLKKPEKNQKNGKKSAKKNVFSVFGVEISHPNKMIFKKEKISKKDVALFYEKVSARMFQFVKDRPMSVVRCSKSLSDCFYKKHPTVEKTSVGKISIQNDDGENQEYFFLKDKDALLEQVQLGTLEFHIWGAKAQSIEKPDYMVFDLDPDEKLGLEKVRQGVKDLKKILDGLKLKSFLKTSGGKGYHICVPLMPNSDWNSFHDFAENVAKLMEKKWPERYTTNIRKENRKGKIFVDFMRNTRGATSVAPYSLRARAGAKVSTPIFWSELEKIAPDQIDMSEAIARLNKVDPWRDFFSVKQKLKKVL